MIEITPKLNEQNRIEPLYFQLYQYFKSEIQSGRIPSGVRLPSIRTLSNYLNISRNTVETTYQQLIAEGYVESRPRIGLYVIELESEMILPLSKIDSSQFSLSRKVSENLSKEQYLYDFSYGKIDLDNFPYSIWKKFTNKCLNDNQRDLLLYGNPQGEIGLRNELAKYLHQSRGVLCSSDQIIIGAGTQQTLSLLCQLIGLNKQSIAMEEPGYDGARAVFENHGFQVKSILLEEDGINLEQLQQDGSKLVYITPSHQFPNGMVMPISKRIKLLQWAEEHNGYIIEDDYDGEFRYHGKPIPSLQGLDPKGNVIYLGTFSKSLLPSIRLSYMVLPETLLKRYLENFQIYEQPVSRIHQKTLQHFMENGYWSRHIRKMRNIYHKKQITILSSIKKIMGQKVEVIGKDSGLHILLKVRNNMSEKELIESAKKVGVKVCPTSRYYINNKNFIVPMILLGFGGLTEDEINQGIKILNEAWF
jgi:GntR family transcriptional regulator/MocR family aminotransferase